MTRVRALVYWRDFTARPTLDQAAGVRPPRPGRLPGRHLGPARPAGRRGRRARHGAPAHAHRARARTWATKKRHDGITRPSAKQYGRWVTAVARRYGDRVDLWSIWNEPNHPRLPRAAVQEGSPASPRIYRDLYVAGEKAIHGVAAAAATRCCSARPRRSATQPRRAARLPAPRALPLRELRAQQALPEAADGGLRAPRLLAQGQAELPLDRQRRGLDRHARPAGRRRSTAPPKAGAIKKNRPIYLTEFGVQSYPDKIAGRAEAASRPSISRSPSTSPT